MGVVVKFDLKNCSVVPLQATSASTLVRKQSAWASSGGAEQQWELQKSRPFI
jgi:hypothetical protein